MITKEQKFKELINNYKIQLSITAGANIQVYCDKNDDWLFIFYKDKNYVFINHKLILTFMFKNFKTDFYAYFFLKKVFFKYFNISFENIGAGGKSQERMFEQPNSCRSMFDINLLEQN